MGRCASIARDARALNANDAEADVPEGMTDNLRRRNDAGPFVAEGPITDVVISNVTLLDSLQGIRILSAGEFDDDVTINNVKGSVRVYAMNMSRWIFPKPANSGAKITGIGSIKISNFNVQKVPSNYDEVIRAPQDDSPAALELNWGNMAIFSINTGVRDILLKNVVITTEGQCTARDVAYRIKAAGPTAIIADEAAACRIGDAADERSPVKRRIVWSENGAAVKDWHDLDTPLDGAGDGETPLDPTSSEDPLLIFFTSGTVSYPKMVLHRQSYGRAHISTARDWHGIGIGAHVRLNDPQDPLEAARLFFPLDPAKIEFTRPIYPYPLQTEYFGRGDPNNAMNFGSVH